MSLIGNVSFRAKQKEGSGPPFSEDSAESGTHVDSTTKAIRLGSGPVGPNAKPLLDDTFIDTDQKVFVIMDRSSAIQFIQLFTAVNSAKFGILDIADIRMMGDASVVINSYNGTVLARKLFVDPVNNRVIIGDVDGVEANSTSLQLNSQTGVASMFVPNTFDVTNLTFNASYAVNGNQGASGTFTTVDLKTVTVEGGIITSIV